MYSVTHTFMITVVEFDTLHKSIQIGFLSEEIQ